MKGIFVLLLLMVFELGAQDFTINQYRVKDGMMGNFVDCIAQDSTGFVWVGSRNGFSRFDGHHFNKGRIQAADKSLIYNKGVYVIKLDKSGNFWAGTNGLGLVKYNYNTDVFEQLPDFMSPDMKIERQTVFNIQEDKDGDLWIITPFSVGHYRVAEKKIEWFTKFAKTENKDAPYLSALCISADNSKWVGYKKGKGLFRFNEKIKVFESFPFTINGVPAALHIKEMTPLNDSVLMISNEGEGLVLLNIKTHVATQFAQEMGKVNTLNTNVVYTTLRKSENEIFVGTINGGLHTFDLKTNEFKHFELLPDANKNNTFSAAVLFRDKQDNVWVGTHNEGLFLIKNYPKGITSTSNRTLTAPSFCQNPVAGFCRDKDGNLWVTMDGCGVSCQNAVTKKWKNYTTKDGLKSNAVLQIILLPDGTLWMCSWGGGVDVFHPETGKFSNYSSAVSGTVTFDNVKSITFDGTYVWIGTHGDGVNLYDWNKKEFITSNADPRAPFNLKTPLWIISLYRDSKGFMWMATSEGLYMYDKKKLHGFFVDPAKKNAIISSYTANIAEDNYGGLWVGTIEGLCLYNYTSRSFVASAQPLLKGAIKAMVSDDDGNMWISVNSNIVKYNSQKDSVMALLEIDGAEMPPYFEGSVYADDNGDLYFGHAMGFTRITPDEVKPDLKGLKIILKSLSLNNATIDPYDAENKLLTKQMYLTKSIELQPEQNNFAIDFTTLDPSNRGAYLYLYKLDGFDAEWQKSGEGNRAVYTNLSPGTYTFSVKATNLIGQEILRSQSVEITILPQWYQELWVKAVVVALILLLFYGLVILRVRAVRKSIEQKAQ